MSICVRPSVINLHPATHPPPNNNTHTVYLDETKVVPKNATVLVKRVAAPRGSVGLLARLKANTPLTPQNMYVVSCRLDDDSGSSGCGCMRRGAAAAGGGGGGKAKGGIFLGGARPAACSEWYRWVCKAGMKMDVERGSTTGGSGVVYTSVQMTIYVYGWMTTPPNNEAWTRGPLFHARPAVGLDSKKPISPISLSPPQQTPLMSSRSRGSHARFPSSPFFLARALPPSLSILYLRI